MPTTRQRRKQRKRRREALDERQLAGMLRADARREREAEEEARRAALPTVEDEVRAGRDAAVAMSCKHRNGRPGETRPRVEDKDLDRLVALAWDAGWRVDKGGKHLKVFRPDGKIVSVPGTPSRQRTLGRIRSEIRRGGLAV